MPSDKQYLHYIMEQFSESGGVTYRAMMGEYVLYYFDRVFGGIYDDRLLVKNLPSARAYLRETRYEIPYPTGKPMLLVDDVDDPDYLAGLLRAMDTDLG